MRKSGYDRGWLLPRHRVRLFVAEGDGERFARLFRETWARIPLRDRRRLCKHWREAKEGWPFPFRVRVTLEGPWSLDRKGEEKGWNHASCSNLCYPGRVLKFFGAMVDQMPEEIARALIAHELGHAYFRACGDDYSPIEEEEVYELLAGWGFDEEEANIWLRTQGEAIWRRYEAAGELGDDRPPSPTPRR